MREPKKKSLKIRCWCPGGGRHLQFEFTKLSRRLSLTPYKRKIKYARCEVCDQRFEVQNKDCHDPGCTHQFVPRHKAFLKPSVHAEGFIDNELIGAEKKKFEDIKKYDEILKARRAKRRK